MVFYENQVFEGLTSKFEIVATNREKTEEMVSFKLHFHFFNSLSLFREERFHSFSDPFSGGLIFLLFLAAADAHVGVEVFVQISG
jgi:hypothetical protein